MQCNTQALHALSAVVSKVEDKLACLIDQTKGLQDSHASITTTPKEVGRANTSYAETASVHLPVNQVPPIHLKSTSRALGNDSRASNVILFGLPEGRSIIESKKAVDEVFEYLAGRPVVINDIFRLGKYNQQSPRPRPLLVKLSAIWDKKLILSRKRNLRDFKIKRLFLREDVPPDHKLRRRFEPGEKKSADQIHPISSVVPEDDLITEQQTSPDRSPSPSLSTSSLTSVATVVLDEANNDV